MSYKWVGGVYIVLTRKGAYLCKRTAIKMGGVSRYFSERSRSGVDVALLLI